jgi:hypothetical protein
MRLTFTKPTTFVIATFGILCYVLFTSSSTGITGRSTIGCGGVGCHGAQSTGTVLSISGVPGAGWTASTAYTITISVTNTSKAGAGFDLTVTAGTLSGASSGAQASGSEAGHTTPKTFTSGTATWTVTWTAPATGTSVVFHLAGNAVNLNSTNDAGDVWNTLSQTFNKASSVTAPAVTNGTPSPIAATTATIKATVNANGATSTITCAYGLTAAYGSTASVTPSSASGTSATSVSAALSGLTANTTYHYRFSATNSAGTTNSTDATFKTSALSVANLKSGSIIAYPNPVNDVLIIDPGSSTDQLHFTVTDITGKVVPVQVSQTGNKYNMATSGLTNGVYTLHIVRDGVVYGTCFLKE